MALPLAQKGADVTALELAPSLARRIRERSAGVDTLSVVEADMADFTIGERFGCIFSVRSSFFHLGTVERQIRCIRSAADHLRDEGLLVLDCFVPDLELLRLGSRVQMSEWSADGVVLRAIVGDRVTQKMTYREVRLLSGAVPQVLPAEQRFCWPSEMDVMAMAAGLELVERHADYRGTAFAATSPRHVSVYRRCS